MKFFRTVTASGWVVATSIFTLITGAATTVINCFQNDSTLFYIFLGLFLIGISTILIQILISSYITNELVKNMSIKKSGILLPQNASHAQKDLEDLVRTRMSEIGEIKIICYGTSAYGEFVSDISNGVYDGAENINIEVIVCSSEHVYRKNDKNDIDKIRLRLNNSPNISVFDSKELPTIRACVVYNKSNKPIWNCLQVYTYSEYPTAQYKSFYALVGNENNDLLKENTKLIEKEFERLKKA